MATEAATMAEDMAVVSPTEHPEFSGIGNMLSYDAGLLTGEMLALGKKR